MSDELSGLRIAILATDGVEELELTEPRKAVTEAGATADVVSIGTGPIQAMSGDIDKADTYEVQAVASKADAADYHALIMPGGTINADTLRVDADVRAFVKGFFDAGKPVGVICHAPWTLVEADLVRGRTLTSFPSVRTDVRNAGGTVVDAEVVRDDGLISSRDPDDLPAFCAAIVEEFAKAATR